MHRVSLDLDAHTLAALQKIAAEEGCGAADLIREAIRRDLFRRSRAKTTERADERLVAPLRALLADDLAYASDWHDLQARLRRKGYALNESGGGLALFRFPEGQKLAKASDLGYSYARLMQRFGAPFPGHSHDYLVARQVQARC
ncbi:MAG: hypothetical protein H6898_17270 [Rhodobacter sp.]|nr:hypothetical protein [Paracoccaceae bacterium]MCC0078309.1 hypothetical protein [Rhodobacter sp.]